jgi:hypothetical protein
VRLQKALYGTLQSALLFSKKLVSTLESWGFVLNPYDRCVANKMMSGKQCTILWHVDDLKISHENPSVVSEVIELIRSQFGKEAPLTERRGTRHDYLGMTIDYAVAGKVQVSMTDYIQNMLSAAPSDMDGE